MTGLESILTQTADLYLFKKSSLNQLRQTVNNMVSFNAIKNFMVEMFYHPMPINLLMKTLNSWFIFVKTYRKRLREVIRKKSGASISLNYYKRVFKPCF
jgi:hypothetical protein